MIGIHKAWVYKMSRTASGDTVITFIDGAEQAVEVFTPRQYKKLCVMAGGDDPVGKQVGIWVDGAGDVVDICRAMEINMKRPLWERAYGELS